MFQAVYEYSPNVRTQLERFVQDVDKFNDALAETGALVSGSTMLAALVHETYYTDLDIVVDLAQYERLERHLIEAEGYKMTRFVCRQPAERTWMLRSLYKFVPNSESLSGYDSRKIDLCITITRTPEVHISLYDMTCVMNYWDGRYFWSAFKDYTLSKQTRYRPARELKYGISDCIKQRADKYKRRGFEIIEVPTDGTTVAFCGFNLNTHKPSDIAPPANTQPPVTSVTPVVGKSFKDYQQKLVDIVDKGAKEIHEEFELMVDSGETQRECKLRGTYSYHLQPIIFKRFSKLMDWPSDCVDVKFESTQTVIIEIDVEKCLGEHLEAL